MLGTTRAEYVFIRLSVAALRSIVPLSFVYVTTWLALDVRIPPYLPGGHRFAPAWTLIWPVAECAFYLAMYRPWSKRLQQAAVHPPLRLPAERKELFERCHAYVPDMRSYISGWFGGADLQELKRDNVEDWLLWSVFSAASVEPEWKDELEGYVHHIEELLGHEFPLGRNANVKSIRLTLDEVEMLPRPLVWYMIVMLVDTITYTSLRRLGFTHHTPPRSFLNVFPPRPLAALLSKPASSELPYWVRPHRSSSKKPVLFLHGIGIGLWPYVSFLQELAALEPDVGVMCMEFLPISMRMTLAPMPDRLTTVRAVHAALDAHFAPGQPFVATAHSYGTVVAAHLLRADARRVAALALVDPIPLLLHLPSTAHNFVYRRPGAWRANEHQLWYFASRDPGVAHTLARRFFWPDNIMWKADLQGVRTAVVLSERDQIIPAAEVWMYLTGAEADWTDEDFVLSWTGDELEVLFYKDADHSQVFESRARRAGILDILQRLSGET